MISPPDLMRRLDRKLDIRRGLSLTYEDLELLVATGAYAKLQEAVREYRERQCLEHTARGPSTNGATSDSIPERGATSKSSGMTESESGSEALARAQRTLTPERPLSTGNISTLPVGNTRPRSAGRVR